MLIKDAGWLQDEYVIRFSKEGIKTLSEDYRINKYFINTLVVGLIGWDEFILSSGTAIFRCPTVPMQKRFVKICGEGITSASLLPDNRFRERIKWYITPLIFGGSPSDLSNVTWLEISEHIQFVRWWNEKYLQIAAQQGDAPEPATIVDPASPTFQPPAR